MTDEGLPLPPAPVKKTPVAKPGANDLDVQMVRDQFNEIAANSNAATQQWADKVSSAAAKGAPLHAPQFKGGGPGLLSSVESELDQTMAVDPNKTGIGDMLKSVGAGMGYMFKHPFTSFKDASMIAKIKEAQAQFIHEYAGQLTRMSEYMADVTRSFGAITDLFNSTNFNRNALNDLMKQKAECGDSAYVHVANALNNSTDPDERAALQKQKQRMDEFMQQRDSRMAREKPTVDGLGNRVVAMEEEIGRQRQVIEEARRSRGPSNTTAGGRIIDSTHIRSEAVDYARELRDVLAGSRARFDKAMSSQ